MKLNLGKYHQVKLEKHLDGVCQMISRKLNVPARLVPCMIITKWRTLINAFFLSHSF